MQNYKNGQESILNGKPKPDSGTAQQRTRRPRRGAAAGRPHRMPKGILSKYFRRSLVLQCGDDSRFWETLRRADIVFRAISLQYTGEAKSEWLAAKLLQTSSSTLNRFHNAFLKHGIAGLIHKEMGSPAVCKRLNISDSQLADMVAASADRSGLRRIRAFLASSDCPPELREKLKGKNLAPIAKRVNRIIQAQKLLSSGLSIVPTPAANFS